MTGNLALVESLLDFRADVHECDEVGWFVHAWFVREPNAPRHFHQEGDTPLQLAVDYTNVEVAEELLNRGAKVDVVNHVCFCTLPVPGGSILAFLMVGLSRSAQLR